MVRFGHVFRPPPPVASPRAEARVPHDTPPPTVPPSGWQPPTRVVRNGEVPHIPLTPPVEYDEDGYPCADAEPMARNTQQLDQMFYGLQALRRRYRKHPEVCVMADVCINYRKGDHNAAVAPDLLVAFGVWRPHRWPSYKLWEQPLPALVMEVLSQETARRDLDGKFRVYEWMGVPEYWLHDPHGRWIEAGVRGYRLSGAGVYEEIAPIAVNRWYSEGLGLVLRDEGGDLRFHDPVTGRDLPTAEEEADAREALESQAGQEARARQAAEARAARAEARVAELEALLRADRRRG